MLKEIILGLACAVMLVLVILFLLLLRKWFLLMFLGGILC